MEDWTVRVQSFAEWGIRSMVGQRSPKPLTWVRFLHPPHTMSHSRLSDEEFYSIYSKVPRLNVDLIIRSEKGILFALRAIEPDKGTWHFPGGTVYKGESIASATVRIAKSETNLDVVYSGEVGYIEAPQEMRGGHEMHTVSIVIEAKVVGGELRHDENADEVRYFTSMPEGIMELHAEFLRSHGIAF